MEKDITVMRPGDFAGTGRKEKTDLAGLAEIIRSDEYTQGVTESLRAMLAEGDPNAKDFKQAAFKIAQLHSFCYGRRAARNVNRATGFLCMDIDDYDGDYAELKEAMWEDGVLNPCLVFFSPSGKLKVVVRAEGVQPDNFYEVYGSVMLDIHDRYGIKCDPSCNDIVRNTFVSHDPGVLCDPSRTCDTSATLGYDRARYSSVFGKKGAEMTEKEAEKHDRDVAMLLTILDRGEDGYPVYDRTVRRFVGRRSEGNCRFRLPGIEGNEMKMRINAAAMAIFDNNAEKAQEFIDTVFTDHGDVWSPCRHYAGYRVSLPVLRKVVAECRFRVKYGHTADEEFIGNYNRRYTTIHYKNEE